MHTSSSGGPCRPGFARGGRRLLIVAAGALGVACGPATPRDSVPTGTDERRDSTQAPTDYEHVARRAHATVALAEARGLAPGEGASVAESLADNLEGCVRQQPSSGAVRIVARVDERGTVDGLNVRVEPGQEATVLRCLVAPLKLLVFRPAAQPAAPAQGTTTRGLALEATWRP